MKTIQVLSTSLALLISAGQLHATNLQLLFTDDFTNGVAVYTNINSYLPPRQHGTLATQSYNELGQSWQLRVDPTYGFRIFPSGGTSPRASIAHNFTETGEFHMRVKLQPVTCDYCYVDLGTVWNAAHRSGSGIAFEVYTNGDVKFYAQGNEVTAAATNFGTANCTLDVYVSTDPSYSGSGSAVIHARVNGDICDLNGGTAGYSYSAAGFAQNYIMVGAYEAGSMTEARVHGLWVFDRTPMHGVGWWHGDVGPYDPSNGSSWFGQWEIESLSPAYFQERVPYFGDITGKNSCTFGSTNQATMDKQLDYAIAAGLKYIVWDTYPPALWANNLLDKYGLQMYLTSSRTSSISFCADIGGNNLSSDIWSSLEPWYLDLFTNTAYFKVLDDRPLLYVFQLGSLTGSTGAVAKVALDNLRAASIAQGSGDPYIVGYCWSYTEITNAVNIFGDTVDAYSRYAGGVGWSSTWNSYRNELSHKYMPEASTGWDPFPRIEHGNGYARSAWMNEATPYIMTASLNQARNWVNDYPLSAEVPLVHSYGWMDECEGGRVVPSLFKGVDRINAFAAATGGAGVTAQFKLGTTNLDHNWKTISFGQTYDYPPVVILGTPSNNGTTPIVTRVRNVTRTNFQAKVQEFECDDGGHMTETVDWLAIPPGNYTIDGKKVYAAKAWVTDDLRLFEDDFLVTTATSGTNVNVDISNTGKRLKGFTAYEHVIPYVCGGASWQQQLTNNTSYVLMYPNGSAYPASLTPDYNFKESGRFRIEAETKADTADYMVLACGSQYKTNLNPADGFAVRIYSNGMVRCYSKGSEITAAATTITTTSNYYVKIAVDTPPAFNGPGAACFRVTVNDQPIVFNASGSNTLVYSRSCLTNNYITLGAYNTNGLKSGKFYSFKLFDNTIAAVVPTDTFASNPVVLAQVETDYNTNAVVPRVCEVTTNEFLIHLQPQETNAMFTSDGYQVHSGEITGFVVMDQGTSTSGKIQAGLKTGITNTAQTITFSSAKTTPRIFATLNTFNNLDPVVLRQQNLTNTSVQLFGQEETSYDSETTISTSETAGWAVFGQ